MLRMFFKVNIFDVIRHNTAADLFRLSCFEWKKCLVSLAKFYEFVMIPMQTKLFTYRDLFEIAETF